MTYYCRYRYLCTEVWDPTAGSWKIFDIYDCGAYSVNFWHGWGGFLNNQTPGTRVWFRGQNGTIMRGSRAFERGYADWEPIWSIANCV